MSPRGKKELWLVATIVSVFPTIFLVLGTFGMAVNWWCQLAARGSYPSMEEAIQAIVGSLHYSVVTACASIVAWFCYRKYAGHCDSELNRK